MRRTSTTQALLAILVLWLALPGIAAAQEFTQDFRCQNWCTAGTNPYFPLWPGHVRVLEGEDEDEGETFSVEATHTILFDTELVDGVLTRVLEERELEDGELVEVSRNFVAICRETGDIWYFGEDVDDYEDGVIVAHEGAWRAGENGATPGILMPGSPILGARFFEEVAPGIALDQAEIIGMGGEVTVPFGTYSDTVKTQGTSALEPGVIGDEKDWAFNLGNIVDGVLQLTDVTPPPCVPGPTTHCLANGRFKVEVEWDDGKGNEGMGNAILPCDDSGEFWFFSPNNTELVVKVLDACGGTVPGFDSFWVFAGGLTDVEFTLTVTDTLANEERVYDNDLGVPFPPVTDTSAFFTCDVGGGDGDGDGDGDDDDDGNGDDGDLPLDATALFIEINDTDGDAGIQLFLDGEGWDEMGLSGPDGESLFEIEGTGSIGMQGVTELFFESAEPSFEEQSLAELLALFPEGKYEFDGTTTDDVPLVGEATLSHALPDAPVLVSPADGAEDVDPDATVIEWMPVADPPGSAIVSYEVIVETNEEPLKVFKADMKPDDTTVTVPPEFMQAATAYKFEVLAKEASGNQTISEREFATVGGAIPDEEDGDEEEEEEEIELDAAAIFIEINSTDGDAGIQLFLDGEGWKDMGLTNPDDEVLFKVMATGSVGMQGITEFFFESAEPSFEEQSLAELLALFPEGVYEFEGATTDDVPLVGEATLTHALPDGPLLVLPAEDDEDVDPENAVIQWMPVADPPGSAIINYEVVIETEEGPLRVFKADVGPGTTTLTVPPEFLDGDTAYKYEVLAKETSGNQTISEREFATAEDEDGE